MSALSQFDETSRYLTPQSLNELRVTYRTYGFFEVPLSSIPVMRDAEIYANGDRPLHAHKITNPTSQPVSCESKMGNGPIITHPRDMLASARRNQPNVRVFGNIVRRYRYSEALYKDWWEKTYTKTASGRIIRKQDATMSSWGRIVERNSRRTRSGRVIKSTTKGQVEKEGR